MASILEQIARLSGYFAKQLWAPAILIISLCIWLQLNGGLSLSHLKVVGVTTLYLGLYASIGRFFKTSTSFLITISFLTIGSYAFGGWSLLIGAGLVGVLSIVSLERESPNPVCLPNWLSIGGISDIAAVIIFSVYVIGKFLLPDIDLPDRLIQGRRDLIDKDELFFLSIASTILKTGVPSTGVDGFPYYSYHNLWPYLLACVARMTASAPFEVYRATIGLFLFPAVIHAVVLYFRTIGAPRGSLFLFLVLIMGIPLISDPLFRAFSMWTMSSGLTLSFIFLTIYLSVQREWNISGPNIVLAALASYAKISTGVVIFLANIALVLKRDTSIKNKVFWVSANCIGLGAMLFITMGYWGNGDIGRDQEAYMSYISPKIDLGHFFATTFAEYNRLSWIFGTLFIAPIALYLSKVFIGRNVVDKEWVVVWVVTVLGTLAGVGVAVITYEHASKFGSIAVGIWPATLLVAVFLAATLTRAGISLSMMPQELVEPRKVLKPKIAIALMMIIGPMSLLPLEMLDGVRKIVSREDNRPAQLAEVSDLAQYAKALLKVRQFETDSRWAVYIPMSERIFWDSIDDSEFKCLYLPFVLPVLSGIPAVSGYDRNCGEDTIGVPLKGYPGYGYDAYIGVDPVLEPCSQGFKGYFLIQQVDGVVTLKKTHCSLQD